MSKSIRSFVLAALIISSMLISACGDDKPVGETQINKAESGFFQSEESCGMIVC